MQRGSHEGASLHSGYTLMQGLGYEAEIKEGGQDSRDALSCLFDALDPFPSARKSISCICNYTLCYHGGCILFPCVGVKGVHWSTCGGCD